MRRAKLFGLIGLVAAAAACVPQRPPPPQQPQPRQPAPQPQPPVRIPPPPPARADWRDIPLTPGGWAYRQQGDGSQALFGQSAGGAAFSVRCERGSRQIILSRAGRTPPGATMTVRTSETARSLPVTAQAQPLPYVSAVLDARDPLLDHMAFSRGRISIEMPGAPMLVIPAWPEPARVIEDCRG